MYSDLIIRFYFFRQIIYLSIPSKRILSNLELARLVVIEAISKEYCSWGLMDEFLSLTRVEYAGLYFHQYIFGLMNWKSSMQSF